MKTPLQELIDIINEKRLVLRAYQRGINIK